MVDLQITCQKDGELFFRGKNEGGFSLLKYDNGEITVKYQKDILLVDFINTVEKIFRIEGIIYIIMVYENDSVMITKEEATYDKLIKYYHYKEEKKMSFREDYVKKLWYAWKNSEEYKNSVIFAEQWAIQMEKEIEEGKKVCDIALDTAKKIKDSISFGYSFFNATVVLGMFWKYGEEIIKWQRKNPELFQDEVNDNF